MDTLYKFLNFTSLLEKENGRNYKLSVLNDFKDDEDVKYILNFLFSPYIITGISAKKLSKPVRVQADTIASSVGVLEYLKKHNTGRDEDISVVQSFLNSYCVGELYDLFSAIVTKNLPLGIEAKTINKVIPGLIPTFNVQLANKYFDKPEIIKGKEFALTTKIDGMRCIMIKEGNSISFRSRQGQPIEGLVDLEASIRNFPYDLVLDGELVAIVDSKADTYKQTIKTARTKDAEKHNLKMLVFDALTLDQFIAQKCTDSYATRREFLDKEIAGKFDYFEVLPVLYQGSDDSQIVKILNEQTGNGEEGIMINLLDDVYKFGRTNSLLKVKKFLDTEVRITGFEAGINKLSNTLGALLCDYKGNVLKVGSGFSEEERDYIWNHQSEYLGQLITVKYFEETTNAEGGTSLRFPIYHGLRIDL